MLNGPVYESYVRPAILYGSESWCLKECEMGIMKDRMIHGESNVWSAAQSQKKIYGFDVQRCTLLFKVEFWHKQDCCWVEVNLATLTYCGYHQILIIDVSLKSFPDLFFQ